MDSRPPAAPSLTLLSLVVPVHNESGVIEPFLERAIPVLEQVIAGFGPGLSYEIIFVDDGSTDGTLAELRALAQQDARIKIVSLSRCFGKDTALAAGLDHSAGMAVIPIDVDLQDPPELIPSMVERWVAGYEMVTARRIDRKSDSWLKRNTARAFYRIFNRFADRPILENAGDFRLLSRAVVNVLNSVPERARFMKGLFAWVGFSQCEVDYVRAERQGGSTKWRYWTLWNFAIDGITAATTVPLRLWTYLGASAALIAFVYAAFLIGRTLIVGADVPGYASLMVVVLLFGGLNLLSIGIIGEYLGRIYTEAKGRPLYVVKDRLGVEPQPGAGELPRTVPSTGESLDAKNAGGFERGRSLRG